jgi:hypothetical protein
MDVETELHRLATRRTWRLASGALLLILSALVPGIAWVLGTLSSVEVIANNANPTPEQLSAGFMAGAKWGLALGAVFFVSGLVVLGTGIASDLQLKRFRREWAELA